MTIAQSLGSRRLLSLIVPMGIFVGACTEGADQDPTRRVATATISNMLPVNGCSYPVTIDGVNYAPETGSVSILRQLVPAGGTLRVLLEYRRTGRTGEVECGFGARMELPEIEICLRQVLDRETQGTPVQPPL